MRIVFLTHYFPPEVNAPAARTYEMARRWARDGHDVTVVTSVPNCPDGVVYKGYKNRPYQRETVGGIDVIRIWTYIAANRGIVGRIINYVSYMFTATLGALFVRKPDIVIATSPQFFCGWAGVFVSKVNRVPFILEVRDIWPDGITVHGVLTNRCVIGVLQLLARWMYAAASRTVTVGSGYKHILVDDKGVPEEKISVITNGADLELFSPQAPDKRVMSQYGLDGAFVCSYVGTIGMSHGLDTVLRAARLLKSRGRSEVKFMLVGDGALRRGLEERARAEGLDNVMFVGRQEKREIPAFLSVADACLVHLKKFDLYKAVLPSKIFEAWAMKKPVILGVEGCAAEVLRRARAGICMEPENERDLVAGIEKLVDDPELAKELGRAGRKYVVRHFDREVLARDYIRVIEETLAGAERG